MTVFLPIETLLARAKVSGDVLKLYPTPPESHPQVPARPIHPDVEASDEPRAESLEFEAVAAQHGSHILRLCYAILGDRALAEDVAQEALIRIWRALPSYRGDAALSTWIYAIARNAALTALAKRRRTALVSLDQPGTQNEVDAQTHTSNPENHRRTDLTKLVMALPETQRQVTMLFYLEEQSYDQVAAALGMPLGTVKTHLHRARKTLISARLGRPLPITEEQ